MTGQDRTFRKPQARTLERLRVIRFTPARDTADLAHRLAKSCPAPGRHAHWSAHLALQQFYNWERAGLARATRDRRSVAEKHGFRVVDGKPSYAPRNITLTASGRQVMQDLDVEQLLSVTP